MHNSTVSISLSQYNRLQKGYNIIIEVLEEIKLKSTEPATIADCDEKIEHYTTIKQYLLEQKDKAGLVEDTFYTSLTKRI